MALGHLSRRRLLAFLQLDGDQPLFQPRLTQNNPVHSTKDDDGIHFGLKDLQT